MKTILCALLALLFLGMTSCGAEPTSTETTPPPTEQPATTEVAPAATTEEKAIAIAPQTCTGSFTVFLNDPDLSGTNVRKEPKGTVVHKIIRESEEDEVLIEFSESEKGWFKVINIEGMEGPIDLDYSAAWIHGSVLGINTRNYGGETINFYQEANNTSKTVTQTTETLYNLTLVDFCGAWVKVKGTNFEGWVEQDWLCGSSLTNCS